MENRLGDGLEAIVIWEMYVRGENSVWLRNDRERLMLCMVWCCNIVMVGLTVLRSTAGLCVTGNPSVFEHLNSVHVPEAIERRDIHD